MLAHCKYWILFHLPIVFPFFLRIRENYCKIILSIYNKKINFPLAAYFSLWVIWNTCYLPLQIDKSFCQSILQFFSNFLNWRFILIISACHYRRYNLRSNNNNNFSVRIFPLKLIRQIFALEKINFRKNRNFEKKLIY